MPLRTSVSSGYLWLNPESLPFFTQFNLSSTKPLESLQSVGTKWHSMMSARAVIWTQSLKSLSIWPCLSGTSQTAVVGIVQIAPRANQSSLLHKRSVVGALFGL